MGTNFWRKNSKSLRRGICRLIFWHFCCPWLGVNQKPFHKIFLLYMAHGDGGGAVEKVIKGKNLVFWAQIFEKKELSDTAKAWEMYSANFWAVLYSKIMPHYFGPKFSEKERAKWPSMKLSALNLQTNLPVTVLINTFCNLSPLWDCFNNPR